MRYMTSILYYGMGNYTSSTHQAFLFQALHISEPHLLTLNVFDSSGETPLGPLSAALASQQVQQEGCYFFSSGIYKSFDMHNNQIQINVQHCG